MPSHEIAVLHLIL